MLKKLIVVGTLMVVALSVFGIGMVAADDDGEVKMVQIWDDDMGWIAAFGDGRINNTDMLASTVVYYDTEAQFLPDADGVYEWREVIVGIELWTIDSESAGQLALYVPISAINSAMNATSDVQVAAGNGVTLNFSPSADAFYLTGPQGYTFTWACW